MSFNHFKLTTSMCTVNSTVLFGIVIKTWTLLVSAYAFSKIYPILLALDLISFRSKQGTLRFRKRVARKTNFGDLPVEIIELIRKQVFRTINMANEAEEYGSILTRDYRDCECVESSASAVNGDYWFSESDWTNLGYLTCCCVCGSGICDIKDYLDTKSIVSCNFF